MKARDTAAALYASRTEFLDDEYRYLIGPGFTYSTDTAYVLAHRVNVAWPIERMRREVDTNGDCWFVFVAAGDLGEIAAVMFRECPLKWVAFERENHPHLVETKRFLNVRSKQEQQQSRKATGAVPCRTAADELVPDGIHEAAADGNGAAAACAIPATACNPDAG